MKRENWQRFFVGAGLLVGGMIAGGSLSTSNVAHGELRPSPQPPAFQSGGQLSVPVLKEIAATLHQIDARLARLEAVATKLQTPRRTAGANE